MIGRIKTPENGNKILKLVQNFRVSGPLNDLLVVDLDVYKFKNGEKCEILEKFYDNNVMNHKGIVQKTPRMVPHPRSSSIQERVECLK